MTAFRYSSGLSGAPRTDMYINVQCKTSWSPLGFQVANLAPTLLKPMARGRISLLAGDAGRPCVEFNFTGHCASLAISSYNNKVTLDSVDNIIISGYENNVTYHSGKPKVTDSGYSNNIHQG